MAAEIHVEPTNDDWHGGVTTHGHEEQRCVLERTVMVHRDQDCETSDGDTDGEDGVRETMARLVGQVCEDHSETKGGGPWWYAVKLSLNLSVAIAVNDRRAEVGVATRELAMVFGGGVL